MLDIFKQFDAYNLQARVYPALIAGLPTLAFLFMLVPWDSLGLSNVTVTVMGAVLLFAFADVARSTGKSLQAKLGTGSTPEQWHRGNPDVAETAKDRYRAFIAGKLGLPAPTAAEEQADPQRSNDFYTSAGNWLREHTRDTKAFSILFKDNITYGYRRNLLGLKPVALTFNGLVLALCAGILYIRPAYFSSLAHLDEKMASIMAAVVMHSVYMIFAVGKPGVREASRAYGRQLILSCETLMDKSRPATVSASKRKPKAGSPKAAESKDGDS